MELSNEQRELISAYLDGEVNASERALAKALLERSEAASYFDSLKRIRALAQSHGAAKAPANFAALVRQSLEGDFDGISRPTSNSGDYDGISRPTSNQAPIHSLPQATWRMPLLAAAAAIVMAISIFAFNALVLPNQTPSEVAQHRSAASIEEKQGYADVTKESGTLDDHNEDVPTHDDAESLKKTKSGSSTNDEVEKANRKKPEDAANEVEGKKSDEYARRSRETGKEGASLGKDDDKNATPEKSEKWREGKEDKDGSESDGVATGGGSGGAGGSKNTPEGKGERNDRGRSQGEQKPTEAPAPTPPAADAPKPEMKRVHGGDPAQDAKAKEIVEEITIAVSGERAADSASFATDVLQVASVYGEVKSTSNESGTSIEVEVSEDQVEEMVAALNKLAKAPAPAKNTAGPADSQTEKAPDEPARARDYLPRDLRGAVDGDATKDKPKTDAEEERKELEKPKSSAPAEGKKKIRIVVRLK